MKPVAESDASPPVKAPLDWIATYLGHVVDTLGGSTPSKENLSYWDGDVPWVSPKDMKREVIEDSEDHVSPAALRGTSLRLIPPPAVLMVTRGMILNRTVPVAITARPVTVNQDMKALIPRPGVSAEFLGYVLRASHDALLARVEEAGHGTKALRTELWKKVPIAIPPPELQHSIVAFLDRKTAAIDALTRKKERLLELFQEKVQALMTQVVTKGLDPNVPMRSSGIYWLGMVPSHWKLERNGRLFRETDERGLRDLPVLSVSISTGVEERDFSEDRIQPKMSDFADYKVARRGDVVFNKMRMWQGAVGVAPMDGFVSPDYTVLRPGPKSNPWFFSTLFRSTGYTCEVNRFSHGIAMDRNRIYWDAFKSILSPVPPRPEQDAIVAEIQRLKDKIGGRVAVLERGTALLRECRQALISAAVTGKIDLSLASTGADEAHSGLEGTP